MSEEPITIDICADYGGCFNFGDGYATSLPDEVRSHPRSAEILAIEKALEVWADWFDTNDPQNHPKRYFPWDAFYRCGYHLAKQLAEILENDGYEVLYCHRAIPETSDVPKEFLSEEKAESKGSGCGAQAFIVGALVLIGGLGGASVVKVFGN